MVCMGHADSPTPTLPPIALWFTEKVSVLYKQMGPQFWKKHGTMGARFQKLPHQQFLLKAMAAVQLTPMKRMIRILKRDQICFFCFVFFLSRKKICQPNLKFRMLLNWADQKTCSTVIFVSALSETTETTNRRPPTTGWRIELGELQEFGLR